MGGETVKKAVIISGGFDPVHSGHVDYLVSAAEHGRVFVLLNSDAWLRAKKGYVFMDWTTRAKVLHNMKGVELVLPVEDTNGTVCSGIEYIHSMGIPCIFAKGGDRGPENTPEKDLCDLLGIEVLWGCGGGKTQSSSEIVKRSWNLQDFGTSS